MLPPTHQSKGAYYRKVDLHIHTPASKCYGDKGVDATMIISGALSKGLEIIAVTDHNDISWIEAIQEAAKRQALHIFPGIEITAAGGHVLAIFEEDYPLDKLGDLLARVGIRSDMRGKKEVIADDFEKVLVEIKNAGGIAIASHANSRDGGILQHPQGQYRMKMYCSADLTALEFTKREDIEKFSQGTVSRYPPKACLQSSDAHKISEIGQRYTYLKVDEISLEGIRQAFLDYEVKIRYQWDNIKPQCPRIKRLSVNQGFFEGEIFKFHPNLNCLVGGTGTGKSTVIEFLRYCFDDISNFEEIKQDTSGKINKLVGEGGKLTVVYEDEAGEELIIERNACDLELPWEEPPVIKNSSGEEAVIIDRPIFFSQGEMSRITSSPIAQLELIDRYLQLENENNEEKRLIDSLRTNGAKLIEAKNKYYRLMSEVKNSETGKLAVKTKYEKLERGLKDPILSEFPKWESEARFTKNILTGLDNLKKEVTDSIKTIDVESLFTQALDVTSPNYSLLKPLSKVPERVKIEFKSLEAILNEKISKRKEEIDPIVDIWKPLFEERKRQHNKSIEEIGEESIRVAQMKLRNLKKRLDYLEGKEGEAKSWLGKIEEFKEERVGLLKMLREIRKGRYEKRLEKAREWEQAFDGQIKIDVVFGGDRRHYGEKLKELLTGSYLYDRDIDKVNEAIEPHNLVEMVLNNQPEVLTGNSGLDVVLMRKLIEQLRGQGLKNLYELELIKLPDLPQIKFEVEPGKEKPLNELSVGTKSTVIVSLAMIEGRAPLIIDQPEDSLDTQFIYRHIVERLRKEKEGRQFILTTHNPNIVVAADAELSYVLDATADKGTIKSEGGIDRIDTNKLVLLHLEGGPEAFKLRARKYLG